MAHPRKFFASILMLVLVTAAIILFYKAIFREPTYKGRSLSQVVQHLGSLEMDHLDTSSRAADTEAIRAIGTNGIPYYIRWMAFEPGKLQLAKAFVREKGQDWFGLD